MGKKSEVVLPGHAHVDRHSKEDVLAWINARETRAREEAIAIETLKNIREKVSWCHRAHPVTHYYKCADIVGKYLTLIQDPMRGVKVPTGAEASEE